MLVVHLSPYWFCISYNGCLLSNANKNIISNNKGYIAKDFPATKTYYSKRVIQQLWETICTYKLTPDRINKTTIEYFNLKKDGTLNINLH